MKYSTLNLKLATFNLARYKSDSHMLKLNFKAGKTEAMLHLNLNGPHSQSVARGVVANKITSPVIQGCRAAQHTLLLVREYRGRS